MDGEYKQRVLMAYWRVKTVSNEIYYVLEKYHNIIYNTDLYVYQNF